MTVRRMDPSIVTFEWTRDEFSYTWRGGTQRYRWALMIVILLGVTAFAATVSTGYWSVTAVFFVFLVFLWVRPHIRWRSVTRVHAPTTVRADATGISRTQGSVTRTLTWRLAHVRETNGLIIVRDRRWWIGAAARVTVIVPERAFASPEELAAFRAWLPAQH